MAAVQSLLAHLELCASSYERGLMYVAREIFGLPMLEAKFQ
jgi:hypothetical protein